MPQYRLEVDEHGQQPPRGNENSADPSEPQAIVEQNSHSPQMRFRSSSPERIIENLPYRVKYFVASLPMILAPFRPSKFDRSSDIAS